MGCKGIPQTKYTIGTEPSNMALLFKSSNIHSQNERSDIWLPNKVLNKRSKTLGFQKLLKMELRDGLQYTMFQHKLHLFVNSE